MPSPPDPLTLLRQAVASHQGLTVAAPEVIVCAQCLYQALPPLMDVIRFSAGHVTIYVGHGKLNKVEWLQAKFY